MHEPTSRRSSFWRPFVVLFSLGMVGVASLPLMIAPMLARQREAVAELREIPHDLLVAMSLLNPTLLLAAAVAAGLLLAHRIGLRSHIAAAAREGVPLLPPLRAELSLALIAGAGVSLLIVAIDSLAAPVTGAGALEVAAAPRPLQVTVTGLLYGGITEELITRWGLMTVFAWLLWRFVQRTSEPPRPELMLAAIVVTALLFGVMHLPVTAMMTPLTGPLVVRTILLNTLGGIVFGWLYWRRSLESAMIAHAAGHIVFTIVNLATGAVST